MKRSCATCEWFDPLEDLAGTVGHCRKDPPVIDMIPVMDSPPEPEIEHGPVDGFETLTLIAANQTDITRRGVWPEVAANDWCGKWRARS